MPCKINNKLSNSICKTYFSSNLATQWVVLQDFLLQILHSFLQSNQPFKGSLKVHVVVVISSDSSYLYVKQEKESEERQGNQDQGLKLHSHQIENHCCYFWGGIFLCRMLAITVMVELCGHHISSSPVVCLLPVTTTDSPARDLLWFTRPVQSQPVNRRKKGVFTTPGH